MSGLTKKTEKEEPKKKQQPENAAEPEKMVPEAENQPGPEAVKEILQAAELLKTQYEDLQQQYLRLQADFENFRRRTRQERDGLLLQGTTDMIKVLLPVVDNFERALATVQEEDSYGAGIQMIYRQLRQVLQENGLQQIEALGKPFDPCFHEAIGSVEAEDGQKGLVVNEVQKGYLCQDKLLRPSIVQVGI